MSLTFTTYVAQLSNLMVVASSDANFQTFLPGCIDYAEQRVYRELDLLATRVRDITGSTAQYNRNFSLPTSAGTYLVVENINLISPAGVAASSGTRNPLRMVDRSFIDAVYPQGNSSAVSGTPAYMAMVSNSAIIMGPPPDDVYVMEVIGTQRPTPLSSTNTTTILTTMLPDVFMAASMIFASGYQRDFSAEGDNPSQGASWEQTYQTLIRSANVEELRKKYASQAWTSQIDNPVATPPRA